MRLGSLTVFLGYVKVEGANLDTLVATLKLVVKCKPLQIDVPYDDTCFGHVISKVC